MVLNLDILVILDVVGTDQGKQWTQEVGIHSKDHCRLSRLAQVLHVAAPFSLDQTRSVTALDDDAVSMVQLVMAELSSMMAATDSCPNLGEDSG